MEKYDEIISIGKIKMDNILNPPHPNKIFGSSLLTLPDGDGYAGDINLAINFKQKVRTGGRINYWTIFE